jgi:bifunctional non-homologous end joining protein LigD
MDDTVRLFTRRGYDWSGRYPAIALAGMLLRADSFTVDGEAVVCGPDGVAVFRSMRCTVMAPSATPSCTPSTSWSTTPLGDRKKRLARLLGKRRIGIDW